MMTLGEIIDAFESVEVQGADVDEPEGARWVQVSEQALNMILESLRHISNTTIP